MNDTIHISLDFDISLYALTWLAAFAYLGLGLLAAKLSVTLVGCLPPKGCEGVLTAIVLLWPVVATAALAHGVLGLLFALPTRGLVWLLTPKPPTTAARLSSGTVNSGALGSEK